MAAAMARPRSLAFDLLNSYTSRPFSGDSLGVDISKTGPVNNIGVIQLMKQHGINPREPNWLADIDAGRRQLNNNDLRAQYNDVVVPLNLDEMMTAIKHNQQNDFLYKVLVPVELTDQFNFTTNRYEVFQAPFDEMNPFNVAREAGYRKTVAQTTLKMYKRAASAEYTLLGDARAGPIAMSRMQDTIDKHAELTLICLVINFLVEHPAYEMLKRLQHPVNGFNHAREILQTSADTYSAADFGSRFLNQMLSKFNSQNGINSVVIPKGSGRLLIQGEGEPKPMDGYVPFYDKGIRGTLLARYEAAATSFSSLNNGNGSQVNFYELEDARGYYDDPEESFYRPLTQALVLGEWITHPRNISLEDLESPYATTSAKQLDIATVEHTPLHIKPVLLRHREYLKSNVLFLNRETGAPLSAANDPLSDYVYDCANMYNDDTDQQKEFQESVRTFEHFDNNNPSSDYSKKGTPVLQMYGFRHFCPWVSWDDVNGRVFVPQRIGDIEPKTLHPRYVWQLAEVLHRRLAAMGSKTEAAIQKDLTELFPGWALGLVSADDLADEDHIPGPVDLRTGKAQPGFLGRAGSTPAIFGLPLGSALAPLDGESKDAYLQRVNEDTIRSDLDNDVLDVSDNAWLHMLQHIPDEALESFLGLVYATHKEGRKANDQDNAALAALSAKLAAKSQQPHAAEIIRTATRVIERALGRGVGEVLAARGDKAWYTNDRLAELNKAGPLQLQARLGQYLASEIASLGAPHTGLGPVVTGTGAATRNTLRTDLFSWRTFNEEFERNPSAPSSIKLIYVALLQARFNWHTCDQLARFGLTLFRQNYMRWQIEQLADSFTACASGSACAFLALGHGQVLTGTDAQTGAFAMVAQFHAGVIPTNGAQKMMYFPNALPREHRSGRTVAPITTREHMMIGESRDRRSLLVLPTPISEDAYEYPVSITREPVYIAPDVRPPLANQKTSVTDLVRAFVGEDMWEDLTVEADHFAQYFTMPIRVATHLHKAWAGGCITNDPNDRQWKFEDGTGPLGKGNRNQRESVHAYMGQSNFPQQVKDIELF